MQLVMISVDEIDGSRAMAATYDIPFPMLSDPDASVHDAYNVANALDEKAYERLSGFGISVEAWSKRKHHKIAIPSMFYIGKDQKVRWAHAAHDYKTRPSETAVLAAIEAVQKKQ